LKADEIKDIVATAVDYGDGELIPKEIGSDDITAYRVKGMWYFDKRRGELMYRLLGLMPVGEDLKNLDGDEEKKTNLFWIWYPSIREILHKELVFNDTSNANQISFDQLLLSRRFSSYIYKEDNLYGDRKISEYKKKGLESILESERIKKEILDFEQDLWNR
jgi:gliding motility associated protien GldN